MVFNISEYNCTSKIKNRNMNFFSFRVFKISLINVIKFFENVLKYYAKYKKKWLENLKMSKII